MLEVTWVQKRLVCVKEPRISNLVDDPPLVLGLLEMRVRKEEEHFFELALLEEVWQVLHGVGAKAGDVGVAARILEPQRSDPVLHVVGDLDPDLHSHHELFGKHGGQLNKEASVAAADVGEDNLQRNLLV